MQIDIEEITELIVTRAAAYGEAATLRKQLAAKDAEIARLKETAVITGVDPEQYRRSVYRGTRYKEAFRKLGGHMQVPDFWDSIYEKIGLPPAGVGDVEIEDFHAAIASPQPAQEQALPDPGNHPELYAAQEQADHERYPMCADQPAQINCAIPDCKFNSGGGKCTNIAPALSLNESRVFVCWSREELEQADEHPAKKGWVNMTRFDTVLWQPEMPIGPGWQVAAKAWSAWEPHIIAAYDHYMQEGGQAQ